MTVTYKLNGEWYHSSSRIPYTCALDTSKLKKGENTISISANGKEKTYNFVYNPNDEIKVVVNGNKVAFDVPPVIVDGRTLIPLRACAEALGAQVEWMGETQTAIIKNDTSIISVSIGQNEYELNGEKKLLDVPAQIIDGRTLVPVRAISEAFGAEVKWEAETKTVYINK